MLVIQVIINGILLGGLYACMAIGFSLVWGVMNLINLAHGSMIIIGAYIAYMITKHFGIDPFLVLPISGATLFLLGYVIQKVIINRVVETSVFLTLVLTFGLDMVLMNANIALFTADLRSVTTAYTGQGLTFGEIRVPYTRFAVFVVALLLTIALYVFLQWTRIGQAIRATSQNLRAAKVVGIDTNHIYAITFGVGACMAGITGTLIAVVYSFSPVIGSIFTMKSFIVVVLGGLGSISGAIVAGTLLGVAENLVSGLFNPGYRDVISYVLLVVILVSRPHGLFGEEDESEVKT